MVFHLQLSTKSPYRTLILESFNNTTLDLLNQPCVSQLYFCMWFTTYLTYNLTYIDTNKTELFTMHAAPCFVVWGLMFFFTCPKCQLKYIQTSNRFALQATKARCVVMCAHFPCIFFGTVQVLFVVLFPSRAASQASGINPVESFCNADLARCLAAFSKTKKTAKPV